MKLLSRVRLGVCLGRIADIDLASVNRLFLQIQPGHLREATRAGEGDTEMKEIRSTVVRRALGAR